MRGFYYAVIKPFLLRSGLLFLVDRFTFWYHIIRFRKQNNQFKTEHPDYVLPPDYMLYESYQLNYRQYFKDAQRPWLLEVLQDVDWNGKTILEWGCGPGRLIRHLPEHLSSKDVRIIGSDYNVATIQWCKEYLGGIEFIKNGLNPPLSLANESVDVAYSVSVFTHLSRPLYIAWLAEIYRILRHKGLFILTFHGIAFTTKLPPKQQRQYMDKKFVEYSFSKEGHRIYSSYLHPDAMRKLAEDAGFSVIRHVPGKQHSQYISQDIMVCEKMN